MRIFGYEDVKQYNKNKYRLYMKFIVDTYDLETSADMLEVILENEYAVVFKDINPKAPVHLLVVPRQHVESLNELDDEVLLGKLMMTVKEAAKKVGLKAYKTHINTGKEAGQVVFHLHIHVLGEIK